MIHNFIEKPISFVYRKPDNAAILRLKAQSQATDVSLDIRLKPTFAYKKLGLAGTSDTMLARQSLVLALETAVRALPLDYEFWIFDAFRSKETQLALFEMIYAEQKKMHPTMSHDQLYALTREFVAHPKELSRFAIPPHNSGGAVDLVIAHRGTALDMGTGFDSVAEASATAWFEQEYQPCTEYSEARWMEIRHNRRLLFNLMIEQGFVNYQAEWWHYDLGDCIWADTHAIDWFYPSMEQEV